MGFVSRLSRRSRNAPPFIIQPAAYFSSYRSAFSATTAMRLAAGMFTTCAAASGRCAGMGSLGTRSSPACGGSCGAVRSSSVAANLAASSLSTAGSIGYPARPAVVTSAAFTGESVRAPAVAVAPAAPRAHAQEDSVVEVPGPIIAHGGALVGCIAVVAVLTNWLNSDANHDLRSDRWRHGQAR